MNGVKKATFASYLKQLIAHMLQGVPESEALRSRLVVLHTAIDVDPREITPILKYAAAVGEAAEYAIGELRGENKTLVRRVDALETELSQEKERHSRGKKELQKEIDRLRSLNTMGFISEAETPTAFGKMVALSDGKANETISASILPVSSDVSTDEMPTYSDEEGSGEKPDFGGEAEGR